MRRVDRRTNALPTNRPMDTASYRCALAHIKTIQNVFSYNFKHGSASSTALLLHRSYFAASAAAVCRGLNHASLPLAVVLTRPVCNHRKYQPGSDRLTETLSCIVERYPVCYTETDRRDRQTDRPSIPSQFF